MVNLLWFEAKMSQNATGFAERLFLNPKKNVDILAKEFWTIVGSNCYEIALVKLQQLSREKSVSKLINPRIRSA